MSKFSTRPYGQSLTYREVFALPALFSAPMVRALLEGRKTQTRRILRDQPFIEMAFMDEDYTQPSGKHYVIHGAKKLRAAWPIDGKPEWDDDLCPYGKPGDRLWVREAMRITDILRYDADQTIVPNIPDGWENTPRRPHVTSMFMPRWASRITLEITEVRVQRLQEISTEDALAEGIPHPESLASTIGNRGQYRSLWESINGKGSWDANPFVWAISFKRIP
jgi:hypothetical protein